MNEMENMQQLLDEMSVILECNEEKRRISGLDFNILQVLGVSSKEVPVCRLICELLNPHGSHGKGILFLESFLKNVLKKDTFSADEMKSAVITKEELIDNDRRIDLFVRIAGRAFPIEVKLYAPDQKRQCVEYYEYAKRYDENTVIYYLTLDRHEPSADSKGYLKPGEGEPLQLISFADEIVIWLQDCMEKDEVKQNGMLLFILEQFLDEINLMTGRNRKEIAMQIENLIVDKDTFRAANTISAELPTIKAKMMKKVFADIEEELREAKKTEPIYADYNEKAGGYYEQKGSNWPSLNYILNEEKTLALRIEIDHCLYYGVCNWDVSSNSNPHTLKENFEKMVANKFPTYISQKSDVFYLWKYLPKEKMDFRGCNEAYMKLYDTESYKEILQMICNELLDFFDKWEQKEC
jgi:hypothetical protein